MSRLPGPGVRGIPFAVFTLLCLGVAAYAFAYLYQSVNPHDGFRMKFGIAGWEVPFHFFASAGTLLLAPAQLWRGLRRARPGLHRIGGYLYIGGVLLGGVSGLIMALEADGGVVARIGFSGLALGWIASTTLALAAILEGDAGAHRAWMMRSVAFTFTAVTLRLLVGLGAGVLGLDFEAVYVASSWCWLLNLAVCELLLRRKAKAPTFAHARMGGAGQA